SQATVCAPNSRAITPQNSSASASGQIISRIMRGCSVLASARTSALAISVIAYSASASSGCGARSVPQPPSSPQRLPRLLQPLYRHGRRRAQFLGVELHAQLLQHPPVLFELRIGFALLAPLGVFALPLRLQRRVFAHRARVAGGIGAQLVQAQGNGLQVAREMLQPL